MKAESRDSAFINIIEEPASAEQKIKKRTKESISPLQSDRAVFLDAADQTMNGGTIE